jgi:hypothetical protein
MDQQCHIRILEKNHKLKSYKNRLVIQIRISKQKTQKENKKEEKIKEKASGPKHTGSAQQVKPAGFCFFFFASGEDGEFYHLPHIT